jgi:hypothetical protein
MQDMLYGKGNRVANVMRSGQTRCTVCGTIGGAPVIARGAKPEAAEAPVKVAAKSKKEEPKKSSKEAKPKAKKGLKWGKK